MVIVQRTMKTMKMKVIIMMKMKRKMKKKMEICLIQASELLHLYYLLMPDPASWTKS